MGPRASRFLHGHNRRGTHTNNRQRQDVDAAFWAKVQHSDGCWLWTGCRNQKGYGQFRNEYGQNEQAHRYAYRRTVGPIPEMAVVCHQCDNPPCVKPAHLWIGSVADNQRDMARKGRVRYDLEALAKGRRKTPRPKSAYLQAWEVRRLRYGPTGKR